MKKFKDIESVELDRLTNYEMKSLYNLYVNYKDNSLTEIFYNDMSGFNACFGMVMEEELKEFIRSDKYKSDDIYISITRKKDPVTFDNVYKYVKRLRLIDSIEEFKLDEADLVLTVLNGDW